MTDDQSLVQRAMWDDAGGVLEQARLETDAPAVSALMVEYLTWAIGRLQEEYGLTESPTDPRNIRDSLPTFTPPNGSLIVARWDQELVGVAALRTLRPGVVEVKRMYVAPQWQGRRLGSAILDRLLHEARNSLHANTIRLDTCRFMTDAQRLYLSRGFVERSPYEGTEIPPHLQQYWRFFEKTMDGAGEPT